MSYETKESIIGYKFIKEDYKSSNGNGNVIWNINEWKHENKVELCNSGFHACRTPAQSLKYAYGNKWIIVEAKGQIIDGDDKFVASDMRMIKELPAKEILTRFAIACAKNCLFKFEQKYPNDMRPRKAIEAAENYLEGKITKEELIDAADAADAADATAYAAYAATAYADADAADAASAAALAGYAANAADAAYAAASAAADAYAAYAADATTDAERKWQNKNLEMIIEEL